MLPFLNKLHLQLADALSPDDWQKLPVFDGIVSNPPYIPRRETALVPAHVLEHEPDLALFVTDEDPLIFYRVIAEQARTHLSPGGGLFFECNEFNAGEVAELLRELGYKPVYLRKDLYGAERMVMGVAE